MCLDVMDGQPNGWIIDLIEPSRGDQSINQFVRITIPADAFCDDLVTPFADITAWCVFTTPQPKCFEYSNCVKRL